MPLITSEKASSTPDDRKLRLIHDCRELNGYLKAMPFRMESLSDFLKCLRRGDRLVSADISSAYHHVSIGVGHCTYLGFELDGVYYVFRVLPFGLSPSAYVFCQFSGIAASILRQRRRVTALICYVDDFGASVGQTPEPGFGPAQEPDAGSSQKPGDGDVIVDVLELLGFLVNRAKSTTTPTLSLELLGFVINTDTMLLDVPQRRLDKLRRTASEVLGLCRGGGAVQARLLLRLVGQIWSMQLALGLVCRLRARYLMRCVREAQRVGDYGRAVAVDGKAQNEVELFAGSLAHVPRRPLHPHLRWPDLVLESDASGRSAGARAFTFDRQWSSEPIHRFFDERERGFSSTLREMLGYAHAFVVLARLYPARLRSCLIEIVGDSAASARIFAKGGSQTADMDTDDLLLLEALLQILEAAAQAGCDVVFRWVQRSEIGAVDVLSKFRDAYDVGLCRRAFELVRERLGPLDIDRFAAAHNARCDVFNSLFACRGTAAVDALAQDWRHGGVSYVFAPFPLLDRVLDIVERDDALAVIVVPQRTWERYWVRLHAGSWSERIEDSLWLGGDAVVKHAENEAYCFIRGEAYNNRLWVIKTRRLGLGGASAAAAAQGSEAGEASAAEIHQADPALPQEWATLSPQQRRRWFRHNRP